MRNPSNEPNEREELDLASADAAQVRAQLASALSTHGHVFQHTVIGKFRKLFDHRSQWLVEAAEFPVDLGQGTRIDCILRTARQRFFVVCECKRVNPALGHWCFLRVPFVSRTAEWNEIYVEH